MTNPSNTNPSPEAMKADDLRWRRTSEKPRDGEQVIITYLGPDRKGHVMVCWWSDRRQNWESEYSALCRLDNRRVLAWQPFPEPFIDNSSERDLDLFEIKAILDTRNCNEGVEWTWKMQRLIAQAAGRDAEYLNGCEIGVALGWFAGVLDEAIHIKKGIEGANLHHVTVSICEFSSSGGHTK